MSRPELLVDTSVAVALTIGSHDAHASTYAALDGKALGLAGHAWFETYSVLTRLPSGVRRRPQEVFLILRHNFPGTVFLSEEDTISVTNRLGSLAIGGGAVYDALVGYAAAVHQLPLVTRDRRALDVYRALDVTVDLLP